MISRSDRWSRESGLSLLEMLVVLALLAVITASVAGRLTGPSGRLVSEALAADLVRQAQDARLEAMLTGVPSTLRLDLPDPVREIACEGAAELQPITFTDKGRAMGGPVCVLVSGEIVRLDIDWLTGQAEAGLI